MTRHFVTGRNAPTRCPCCGGTEFNDGPASLAGEYRCLGCGADVVGPFCTETVQRQVVLGRPCGHCDSPLQLGSECLNCGL